MRKNDNNNRAGNETKRAARARLGGEAMRLAALPESNVRDFPCVELLADSHIEVENHSGVLEFGEKLIRLHTSIGVLKIEGSGLEIRNADKQGMLIDGKIASISYEKA